MAGEYLPPVVTRLTGDIDGLIRKVAEAKSVINSLKDTSANIEVSFDINQGSYAKVQAAANSLKTGVTVPVRFDTNAAGALAGRAGFGILGWLTGLAGRGVNLFGGVLPGILGAVGGLHLAIDLFAELAAVVLPAAIALGVFGIAASDAAKNIFNQFSAIHTVMDATGQVIPPMTNAMENLHKAVQPQVYGMLGDALTIINNKASEFTTLAKGASDVLSELAARATVAITSSGLSAFMKNAVGDLAGLGNGLANIFGTIGAILKNLPGYAQTFLNIFQGVTGAVEHFANSGFGQGIIKFGLAFHGAFIYIGLLGTAVARIIPVIIGWLSKLTYSAAFAAESMGFGNVAGQLFRLGGAAEVAAGLSWGWAGVAAAAVGVLAYAITTAKDATQNWIAASQRAIDQASAGNGLTAIAKQQTLAINQQITAYQKQVSTQDQVNASVKAGGPGARYAIQYSQQLGQNTNDLRNYQSQLSAETNLYNSRLGVLANKYGGTTEAQNLLTQAGVKMSQMLSKNGQEWKIVQQMVSGVVQGYAAMGQKGGALGADLYVITSQATDQYKAMQQLNQAWNTFISNITKVDSSFTSAVQGMRAVEQAAKAQNASMTGVNSTSITLRTNTDQLINSVETEIEQMRSAHDSASSMALVLSTLLNPAVKAGALDNNSMRDAIYAMARAAGYTGPNAVRPLTGFIDNNRGALQRASNAADNLRHSYLNIPNPERLVVDITGKAQMAIASGLQRQIPHGAAKGAYVGIGTTGHADDVLARVSRGELIVPASMVKAGAVDHLRGRIPGFAGGGFVADYKGGLGGLTPWLNNDYRAIVGAMANDASKSFASSLASVAGGPGGGRSSAGGAYNRAALERLWQQAGGPGGYTALIASAIALAESGGNPNARNPSGASGLWQILGQVYPGNIFNPFVNALNAVSKFDSAHGFSPWVTYTTGAYRAFMDGGGWLMPGNTLVTNNTGQPERVLAPGEHESIEVNVYLDGKQISSAVQREARKYNRRQGPRGTQRWDRPA